MPFTIVKHSRAWWPVKWNGVAEDGTIVENAIELRFRRTKVDESAAFIRDVVAAQDKEGEEGVDLPALYVGFVQRIADDWRGVLAENGEPLPWSDSNLYLLMNEGGLFHRTFNAWRDCLAAEPGIRAGN